MKKIIVKVKNIKKPLIVADDTLSSLEMQNASLKEANKILTDRIELIKSAYDLIARIVEILAEKQDKEIPISVIEGQEFMYMDVLLKVMQDMFNVTEDK